MARIEKNAGLEAKLNEVKEDVKEVKKGTVQRRPWLFCSMALLVVVLGILFWTIWTVASTGLVSIPMFTSLAYEVPQPLHIVTPGVPVETILEEKITSTITQRLYQGAGEMIDQSIQATITEESLTASLRSIVEDSGIEWFDASRLQVVIDPQVGVEVYCPLKDNDLGSAAIGEFSLEAKDGSLAVSPNAISLGSWDVPHLLIASFLRPVLENELAKVNDLMVGYAKISSIKIGSGEMELYGEMTVKIEK